MVRRTMGKRIHREPTAEQAEKYRTIRELIAAEIPEIREETRAIRQGQRAKLQENVKLLKAERELRSLSLGDIGEKTGLSKPAISKLENNRDATPTIGTLLKYAEALGMTLSVTMIEKNVTL